jgi:hypothetical protein
MDTMQAVSFRVISDLPLQAANPPGAYPSSRKPLMDYKEKQHCSGATLIQAARPALYARRDARRYLVQRPDCLLKNPLHFY